MGVLSCLVCWPGRRDDDDGHSKSLLEKRDGRPRFLGYGSQSHDQTQVDHHTPIEDHSPLDDRSPRPYFDDSYQHLPVGHTPAGGYDSSRSENDPSGCGNGYYCQRPMSYCCYRPRPPLPATNAVIVANNAAATTDNDDDDDDDEDDEDDDGIGGDVFDQLIGLFAEAVALSQIDASTSRLRASAPDRFGDPAWDASLAAVVIERLVQTVDTSNAGLGEVAAPIVARAVAVAPGAFQLAQDRPGRGTAICFAAAVALVAVLTPWLFEAAGFDKEGPIAGSIASRLQARYMGFAPVGCWYTFFQRLGLAM